MTDACRRIAERPDQSSRNSENKCRLARTLTLPIFVALRQKVCEKSAVENFCSQKSRPKFTKFEVFTGLIVPNFIALAQTMYEVLQFFYPLVNFCTQGEDSLSQTSPILELIYTNKHT